MKKTDVVKSNVSGLGEEYIQWLRDIKSRYHSAQIKASVKVNSEKLLFNWQLGRDIVMRKAEERWGSGIVENLALDLQREFPNDGFSSTNIWYMKKWYLFYASGVKNEKVQQLVGELNIGKNEKLKQVASEIEEKNSEGLSFPPAFSFVPWGQHIEIITKCKTVDEALFYVEKTIEENRSRNELVNCIKAGEYEKSGKHSLNNFSVTLPSAYGKLAAEITKDNYDFGFLTLPKDYHEKQLEDGLIRYIEDFLLELGKGFAFVGRQKEIIVSGKTRRIDLLFYHIRLRCYVVIELKATAFEPEFAGQLNFYVNAVNHLYKSENDNDTIGLLICKSKEQTEVQLSFEGITSSLGVASYDNVRIKEIEEQLPTAAQLEQRIKILEEELSEKGALDK